MQQSETLKSLLVLAILVFGANFSIINRRASIDIPDFTGYDEVLLPLSLPHALHPITYEKCCTLKLDPNPNSAVCWSVCFSERACEDELYPYSSEEEKEFFYHSPSIGAQFKELSKESSKQRHEKRKQCARAAEKPPPPAEWCQKQPKQNPSQHHVMNLTNIPTGCSSVMGKAARSGSFDRMVLFPAGKLAFCGIPKVGISSWLQFLRFTIGAKDYLSFPHNKPDVNFFWFDNIPPTSQEHVLQSDEWTKAVFLRDPAERFLSAYLDKIETYHLRSRVSKERKPLNMTFADFIDFVGQSKQECAYRKKGKWKTLRPGLTWCTDPHWRPQAWSCGLWELLPHFDFVADIKHADIATKSLLERVGMWHSFGKYYRTHKSGDKKPRWNSTCKYSAPQQTQTKNEFAGFQQKTDFSNNTIKSKGYEDRHQKNSSDKMKQYYTKELLEKVKELYADDYRLLDALSKHNEEWLTGQKMAEMLNPACALD